jgi:dCMP deaminase
MLMAEAMAERSKNPGTRHGAIWTTHDHVLISSGFNGPPRPFPDDRYPWGTPDGKRMHLHAEANAILFGLRRIADFSNSVLYVTGRPCTNCVLLAVQSGVGRIWYGATESTMSDEGDWRLAQLAARMGGLILHGTDCETEAPDPQALP